MRLSPPKALSYWRRLYTDAIILRSLIDVCQLGRFADAALAASCIARSDHAIVIAGAPGEGRLELVTFLIRQVQLNCLGFDAAAAITDTALPLTRNSGALTPLSLDTASASVPQLRSPPSLSAFVSQYSKHPFVLSGFISDWPALNEHPWRSPAYLRAVAGPGRVVPVEVGSDYRDDDWTQTMMPWGEFLEALEPGVKYKRMLYLAQHNLLLQFPQLREDIMLPDYVYAPLPPPEGFPGYRPPGNEDRLVLNAWLGPAGTVSPAHTDPYFNFYAQVVGQKTVWLAPPDATSCMYPYPPPFSHSAASEHTHNPAANNTNPSMSNTSQVDVFQGPNHAHGKWPLFWKEVVPRAMSVTLQPGDLLFFPPGWWHAMRSEEGSFSVSMWF
ncbi:Clavaminate synthase-like protein [Wolfiporia cocos MD-104 SS10]|uniref:Clavaminate synthase-like protein n=1 Tax=Wolfiporia cocos (strain MD-104) TaxID=742152 RepID=A0A2H3JF65_WOLCO|nr:Clavaminate synthase-like protein [Wolfiporia cocos MD-104 SS10]